MKHCELYKGYNDPYEARRDADSLNAKLLKSDRKWVSTETIPGRRWAVVRFFGSESRTGR